jgi:CHAT domain-containing protein
MRRYPNPLVAQGRARARRLSCLLIACVLAWAAPARGGDTESAQASRQSPANTSTASSGGEADVRALALNAVVKREIEGGQIHLYTFELSSDQYVHAVVEQKGIDLEVAILDPDGTPAAEVDRQSGSRGPEAISLITKKSGVHRLRVGTVSKSAPKGGYSVEIRQIRSPRAGDEVRIEAERLVTEAGKLYEAGRRRGETGLLRASIEKFERASKLWRSLNERYEDAVTLYGLGWSYSELGAYGMIKFPIPLYRVRWSYETREDHHKAIRYFKEALAYFVETDDRHGKAITYTGLAWPNLYLGDSEEACRLFSEALLLHRSFGNLRGEAFALYGIGWARALAGDNQGALANFLQSLPLRQAVRDGRGEATTLAGICRMYGRLGQNSQALGFCDNALALFRKQEDMHGIASTLAVKGWSYYSLDEHRDALAAFEQAVELRRAASDITGEANALYGIAKVYAKQGNLTEALAKTQGVFNLIDPLRARGSSEELRTYYFANVQEYYDFYADLLMRLHRRRPQDGYAAAALSVKERARARELLAILAEVVPNIKEEPASEAKKTLSAGDIQELLDKDSILLEYALMEKRGYLWAVTKSSVEGFELPNDTAGIQQAARTLIGMLKETGATTREFEATAGALSAMLLPAKVAAQLRAKKRVIVVADDVLHYVPFSTLSLPTRSSAYAPLIVSHEVVNLPSMATLKLIRQNIAGRAPAPNAVAVLADPVFKSSDVRVKQDSTVRTATLQSNYGRPQAEPSSEMMEEDLAKIFSQRDATAVARLGLRRLRGTREEAELIRSLEPTARVELDFSVNLKTATDPQLGTFRTVHFATHGIAWDTHPELSGLVLSVVDEHGNPQRDWYLDLTSVCNLRLPVELVVLSACDTNLGKNVRGEGLLSLTRGFMYAGAPRVVASLWEVREEATKELMKKFYTAMLREGARPSAALSAAQASMWKEQKWAPSDWASFLFSGEWR